MFSKVFAGIAVAGVLAGVLTIGALAAPAASPTARPAAKPQHARLDVFGGTVTAINGTQLTVRNRKGDIKTFLRTDKTQVFSGRQAASWSAIEVNGRVAVRYETRDGKLYATRIRIGQLRVSGKVVSVSGNLITIITRDGKDVRVTVNADTKYFEGRKTVRKPGSLKDIRAGEHLAAAGKRDVNGSLDAAAVIYWATNAG